MKQIMSARACAKLRSQMQAELHREQRLGFFPGQSLEFCQIRLQPEAARQKLTGCFEPRRLSGIRLEIECDGHTLLELVMLAADHKAANTITRYVRARLPYLPDVEDAPSFNGYIYEDGMWYWMQGDTP